MFTKLLRFYWAVAVFLSVTETFLQREPNKKILEQEDGILEAFCVFVVDIKQKGLPVASWST